MRRHLELSLLILAAIPPALTGMVAAAPQRAGAGERSWVFRPTQNTHAPATGQRVAQYAKEEAKQVRFDPTYQQSGYRHSRSGFAFGGIYDYMHIVETWGQGESIRPYGEWLFPYRAGATPYGPWGNPQGPWTTPFGAWSNPYGLGRLPWGERGHPHYPMGPGPGLPGSGAPGGPAPYYGTPPNVPSVPLGPEGESMEY
jgi:hypothetical protein